MVMNYEFDIIEKYNIVNLYCYISDDVLLKT